MTRQEAIEYGMRWKNAICDRGDTECSEAIQFLNMAIEALQRQSPCDMCENEKEDWWVTCQFCPAEPKGGTER